MIEPMQILWDELFSRELARVYAAFEKLDNLERSATLQVLEPNNGIS